MSQPCHTPDCDGEVGDNSTIGLCKSCYSYVYYWHRRSPKQLIHRAQRIQLYSSRMEMMMPGNVSLTQPRKTKVKPLTVMPGEFKKTKKRKTKKVA
jgi:hypothetical protein